MEKISIFRGVFLGSIAIGNGISPNSAREALLMTDPKRITPRWDKHRREFTVEGEIVKEFRLPSVAQIAILEAFEAADWHASITNPLDGGAKKLHNALCKLNHLQGPAFVRFERNGIGRIIWTIVKKTVPGQEKSEESDGT